MKIESESLLTGINLQKNGGVAKKPQSEEANARVGGKSPDRVDLTMEKREIEQLKERLGELPDIRAERVEALRREIEAGTYRVAGRDVAQRMLKGSRAVSQGGEGHD